MTSMPGDAGCLWWLANSTSACDTPGMSTLSRRLRRWHPIRVAAAALGLAWVALLPRRDQRGVGMGVVGLGLAGLYVSLSAGFVAILALVCYLGAAWLLATPQYRSLESVTGATWRQIGALAAAGLLALLAYAA